MHSLRGTILGVTIALLVTGSPTLGAQSAEEDVTRGDSLRNLREAQLAIRRYWTLANDTWAVHPTPSLRVELVCEEVIGKYCHGPRNGRLAFGNKVATMPVEFLMSDEAVMSRMRKVTKQIYDQALEKLDRAQADAPGDRWIMGQRVFHRVERAELDDAAAVASRCHTDGWWCSALVGYTRHLLSLHAAADSAFDRALATMPDSLRCEWENLDLLTADDPLNEWYRGLDCPARIEANKTLWWLSDPLYLVPGNERRAAHYFRVMHAMLSRDAEFRLPPHTEEGLHEISYPPHGPAYGWALIRMGVPAYLAFGASAATSAEMRADAPEPLIPGSGRILPPRRSALDPAASMSDPPVLVLQYRPPFYHFIPALRAVRAPLAAKTDDWTPDSDRAPEHFRPAFGKLTQPEHQLAWFRRGAWARIIAGLDVAGDTVLQKGGLVGGALVLAPSRDAKPRVVPQARGAPWIFFSPNVVPESTIVSLEAIAAGVGAGRVRYASGPPPMPAQRVTISDLLVLSSADSLPTTLDAAAQRTAQNTRVAAGSAMGLFWEVYGLETTDSLTISLAATGHLPPGLAALASQLGFGPGVERTEVRWVESRIDPSGITGVSVALDLGALSPGSYALELKIEVPGQQPVAVTREIAIGDR